MEAQDKIDTSALRRQRRGEFFLLAEEFLWGWFPIITLLCYRVVAPLWAMVFTMSTAALFFAIIMQWRGLWGELARRGAWPDLIRAASLIMLLFILVFTGLSYTTAGNGALILFMQVFFAYLYFNVFQGEAMSRAHRAGVALMSLGALLVLFPDDTSLNPGDLLILLAAMLAPVANLYQQRARRQVRAITLLFFRNLFSLPFLLLLAWLFAAPPGGAELATVWWLLLINGMLLMGLSKIFWIEALHRLTITKVSAATALAPVFTMLFALPVLQEMPGGWQLAGMLPILLGGILITRPSGPSTSSPEYHPGR
ncbi:MAG: DMT family transporter [Desulfurivibrio sp.]|nr:DMT family transporter [Desulfurivibrio sp.]